MDLAPPPNIAARLERAKTQRLVLIERDHDAFEVMGSMGNQYTVRISNNHKCNCPDFHKPCKHILFVLLKVLDMPESPLLWKRNLSDEEVSDVLKTEPSESKARDNDVCPACFDQLDAHDPSCRRCGNRTHKGCLSLWKKHCKKTGSAFTCMYCRAHI